MGDPADPNAIEEARRKLEELYHKRGFNSAMVTLLEGNKPEDRRAIFVIDEGVKQRVWKHGIRRQHHRQRRSAGDADRLEAARSSTSSAANSTARRSMRTSRS